MGCVRKRGKSWNAQVRISGWRSFTKTFTTKLDATEWVVNFEKELRSKPIPEKNIKTVTSIGSAIPMLSLLDYLVSWLQLSNEGWSLFVDEVKADYYDILEDFPQQSIHTLTLRR